MTQLELITFARRVLTAHAAELADMKRRRLAMIKARASATRWN
jgi:hypothetical protein